jgi:superfamily II DNA or RNA helicase
MPPTWPTVTLQTPATSPLNTGMSDLTLVPVDDVWMRITCADGIARELSDYFTFQTPGSQFMRRQARFRGWDGRVRLFKLKTHLLYCGLLARVLEFAEHRSYTVKNTLPVPVPLYPGHELADWITCQDSPLEIRDYQLAALRTCLDAHRSIIVSPTGSGKSFVIWLLTQAIRAPKTLVIVPTIGLVTQMRNDFLSYGGTSGLIHTVQGGTAKDANCPIYVSTWQSIYELPDSYFDQFECVICDEVHLAKAKSLTGLMEKCKQTPWRFGFTGTITDTECHRLILEGLFGDVTKVTTTNALIKEKQLATIHVKMIVLKYPEQIRKNLKHSQYTDEIDYIVGDRARTEYIARMVAQLKGNTLVLFTLIDKHGNYLYERIKALCPEKSVHFVTGGLGGDDREAVRVGVENAEDREQVIVASYGVFSTGINIRRLHHLVLASAGKSKIRTLQSIGRGLRTHITKNRMTLWDIVDDLTVGKRQNYTWKHAQERAQLYAQEKFPMTLHSVDLEKFSHVLGIASGEPRLDEPTSVSTPVGVELPSR